MSQSTRPLLCRSALRPGESLPSLLARLATLNHYGGTDILKRLCLNGVRDNLNRPWEAATFERIAGLTHIPDRELHAATAHRFAETLTPPGVQVRRLYLSSGETVSLLVPGTVYQQLRPAWAAQFCPRCLEASAYHRVAWIPIAVAACLEHRCLLLDRCPDCWQPVAIQDIVEAECRHCGYELTRSPSTSIAGDAWGQFVQRVIQAWLGLVPRPADASPPALPDQPAAVLYRVLDGLRESLMGVRADWKYLHPFDKLRTPPIPQGVLATRWLDPDTRVPDMDGNGISLTFDRRMRPEASYCLYATALKGLVNWPSGFYEFLRAYRLREVKEFRRQLNTDFGHLYSEWLMKHWQPLAFVQDTFNQYLVDHYALSPSVVQPSRSPDDQGATESFTYTTVGEAARLLDVSPKAIDRLVQAGLLFQYAFPGRWEEADYRFLRRAEVVALRHKWGDGIPLADAARYLGLSPQTTLDLVSLGLLFAERGPDLDGSPHWTFSPRAVTECYDGVAQGVLPWVLDPTTMDLTQAAQILSVVELDVAGILKHVAQCELYGHLPERSGDLGEVLFGEAEIRALLEQYKAGRGWLDAQEIAQRMGVLEATLLRWVEVGLLAPLVVCGSAYYFDPDTAEAFITGHVFTNEAAEIAGVPVDVVRGWTHQGLLKPVSGPKVDLYYRYLFRREDVERLRRDPDRTANP